MTFQRRCLVNGTEESQLLVHITSSSAFRYAPANDADLLASPGGKRDALEDLRQTLAVAKTNVLELDDAMVRPRSWRVVRRRDGALGREMRVEGDALGRVHVLLDCRKNGDKLRKDLSCRQAVRENNAELARVNRRPETDTEESDAKNKTVAEEVEPDSEPTLERNRQEGGPVLDVD